MYPAPKQMLNLIKRVDIKTLMKSVDIDKLHAASLKEQAHLNFVSPKSPNAKSADPMPCNVSGSTPVPPVNHKAGCQT